MKSRQTLLEKFSTFLRFETDSYQVWIKDSRLHRRMTQSLKTQPRHSEIDWVLQWHQRWQDQPTSSRDFLVAYLQESGFWAAQKVQRRLFNSAQSLADLFQIAIAHSEKVLRGFDAEQSFGFSGYAQVIFANALRGNLRQQKAADLCTDWTLLRKTSRKRISLALQTLGLSPAQELEYIWAWLCFKQVYIPTQASGHGTLPPPTAEQWDKISALFNQGRMTQCSSDTSKQTGEAIAAWMLASSKAIRAYLYPQQLSLNQSKNTEAGGEYLDDLLDEELPQGIARLEAEEAVHTRQDQRRAIQLALGDILQSLEPEARDLLTCYYRDHLTQKAIAQKLNIQQYAISRQLARVRKLILKKLAQWSQAELHISPDAALLNSMNTILEDWLEVFFNEPVET